MELSVNILSRNCAGASDEEVCPKDKPRGKERCRELPKRVCIRFVPEQRRCTGGLRTLHAQSGILVAGGRADAFFR